MLKDKHALQQCENQIQEQTERLQFLKTEYEKLKEQMEKERQNGTDSNIETKLNGSGKMFYLNIKYININLKNFVQY